MWISKKELEKELEKVKGRLDVLEHRFDNVPLPTKGDHFPVWGSLRPIEDVVLKILLHLGLVYKPGKDWNLVPKDKKK